MAVRAAGDWQRFELKSFASEEFLGLGDVERQRRQTGRFERLERLERLEQAFFTLVAAMPRS